MLAGHWPLERRTCNATHKLKGYQFWGNFRVLLPSWWKMINLWKICFQSSPDHCRVPSVSAQGNLKMKTTSKWIQLHKFRQLQKKKTTSKVKMTQKISNTSNLRQATKRKATSKTKKNSKIKMSQKIKTTSKRKMSPKGRWR